MSSTDRIFAVLELLSLRPGGVSFGELRVLDLTAPTLSRLLKALIDRDLVEKTEEGLYGLGEGSRVLARMILEQSSREERIRPLLENLAVKTGESAAYYERTPHGICLLAKKEAAQSFHYIPVGEENYQEHHAFLLAMEKESGSIVYETWETAAGFDRLAMALPLSRSKGKLVMGSLGITFARGRYGPEKINEMKEILVNLCQISF